MGQTVYLDLFFIINFSMDFLCFYLAGALLGSKLSVMRMLLSAVIGGIYADVSLFLPIYGLWELGLHIAVCGIMCGIVFGIRSILTHTCVYIATSAVIGGFMTENIGTKASFAVCAFAPLVGLLYIILTLLRAKNTQQ